MRPKSGAMLQMSGFDEKLVDESGNAKDLRDHNLDLKCGEHLSTEVHLLR
jgi:hypothetical protein